MDIADMRGMAMYEELYQRAQRLEAKLEDLRRSL
jgi:hypothetical protein